MKIIYKSRGCGKTTQLIEEAKKLEGYNLIVCMNRNEAQRLWQEIIKKGYELPQPIIFDDFVKGNFYGKNINAFLIDNADLLIQYMAKGVNVHAITFNKNIKNEI